LSTVLVLLEALKPPLFTPLRYEKAVGIASCFVTVIGAAVASKNHIHIRTFYTISYHVILNDFKLRRYVLGLEKLYKLVTSKNPKKLQLYQLFQFVI